MSRACFIVAGALDQRTGGYIYDAAIIDRLGAAGWQIDVIELAGRFPWPDATAEQALDHALAAIKDDRPVIIDALACGGLPAVVERHAARLSLVVLVHHPLADETGIEPRRAAQLLARERRVLACAKRIVTTSAFTAERLQQLDLAQATAAVVEPGVARAPLAVGSNGAGCRLLCVATLIPRKGHLLLVEALSRLAALNWVCDCVGDAERDPGHADAVRRAIADAGLEERIHLHGTLDRDALARHYHQADLFVLPSYYEGYGMVITEAIAHGLPVVTTTGGALARTLPASCGLAVAPGDSNALAEALARFMDNPAQREAAAAAARRARKQHRSWQTAGSEFACLLGALATEVRAR